MKIVSSFTPPHVHTNPYDVLFLWNTKEDILKNVGAKWFQVPLTFIVFFCPYFCVPKKKESKTSLECLREGGGGGGGGILSL